MGAVLLCIASCGGKDTAPKHEAGLIGTWANTERVRESPVITFKPDGTYQLSFENGKLNYPGKYSLDGSTIQVMDMYCGKVTPGVYLFSISRDTLAFKLVDDPHCDRHAFFPQKWARVVK